MIGVKASRKPETIKTYPELNPFTQCLQCPGLHCGLSRCACFEKLDICLSSNDNVVLDLVT